MDAKELRELIRKSEAEFERRKFRRMILVILLYTAISCLVLFSKEPIWEESFLTIVKSIAGCVLIGFFLFYFNLLIWGYVFRKSEDENNTLEYLRKRLREKEQENNH